MTDTQFASLTAWNVALSLRIPVGSQIETGPSMVRVRLAIGGTEERDPTWTIRSGEPEETGEAWFADFRSSAIARLSSSVDGFELIRRDDFVLSSFLDVTAAYYRRALPGGEVISQLQAYAWANSYQMFVVDAASPESTVSETLPIFDAMLRSLRLLPQS